MPVDIFVCSPTAHITQTASQVTVVFGSHPGELASQLGDAPSGDDLVREVRGHPGEHSVLTADRDSGVIHAYRGLSSSYDLFYLEHGGTRILTDHFRDALSQLPVESRTVTDAIVADHFLFRTRFENTYVEEISRIGHGDALSWPAGESPAVSQSATVSPTDTRSCERAVTDLDQLFGTHLRPLAGQACETLLSGGVDSTLLQTYVPDGAPSRSGAVDSPEFESEIAYAKAASEQTNSVHRLCTIAESQYLEHLEATIHALGQPPNHLQTVLLDQAFSTSNAQAFVCGELSDSLFGTDEAHRAATAWTYRHLRVLPPIHPKIAALRRVVGRLHRPPSDPEGFALQADLFGDPRDLSEFIDASLLDARQRARYRYMASRVLDVQDDASLWNHVTASHWLSFFCEATATVWRQLALSRNTDLVTPFAWRSVVDLARSVPPTSRYLESGQIKPIPKRLLEHRLPAYDVDKPKGGSGLPTPRYIQSGPLSSVFDTYDPPAFLPTDSPFSECSTQVLWNGITWALWRDLVLTDGALTPFEQTQRLAV